MRILVLVALVFFALVADARAQPAAPTAPTTQPAPPTAPPSSATAPPPNAPDPRRELARTFFESGLGHYDRGEWSAALADFLKSREILPTHANTENAAVCLRKEGRYDEALDLLEELLRTWSDLSATERSFAEKQITELRALVGSIELTNSEPAATIVIDGRARGTYPPVSGVLRVPAGTRVVRVYKEGFVPLELRVDVPGRQTVPVDARLTPITAGGRLVVTEAQNRALDVLVDDVVVGKTPWEATVPVGRHTVSLRGEGDLGTQPADATVARDDVTRLALAAEPLDASLRVIPTPSGALVSIDGVVVGNGVWEGRLRSGAHTIELAADGFLAQKRGTTLVSGERSSLEVSLERDVSSGAFRRANPGRIFAELDLGGGIGLAFGGDVRASCTGSCSASVPAILGATLRAGYQFSSRLMLGVDAGFLAVSAGTSGRTTELDPRGLAPDPGAADDSLFLRGFRVGPSFGFRTGERFPLLTFRLGAGVFLGSAGDNRTGTFTATGTTPYGVDLSQSAHASYLYFSPEVRVAVTLVSRLEASAGLELLVLAALERPAWSDSQVVLAGRDGVGTFGKQTLTGSFLVLPVPTLGIRWAF